MNTIEDTLFIGKVFQHYNRLNSTNETANEYLSKSNPSEGTVISTYNQQKGRGQIGSHWESEADKNISLSIILYPKFLTIHQQFCLNQAISLAVFDFVSQFIDTNVKIKWPNDIYVGLKKIAGILIQNSLSNQGFQSSVVGLGINVNQKIFLSNAPNPTSLALETRQTYDLDEMARLLCIMVERRYLQLRSQQFHILQQDYLHHFFRFMEDALYKDAAGQVFNGKIVGVEDSGKLLIDRKGGQVAFAMKEVKFIF